MPTCPKCGQAITVDNTRLVHHEMNEYVDSTTGKSYGIVNSKEDKLVIKDESNKVLQTVVKTALFKAPAPALVEPATKV